MLTIANKHNPFKQTGNVWVVELSVAFSYVDVFADNLADLASSVSFFETVTGEQFDSHPDDIWIIRLYCETKPDSGIFQGRIAAIASAAHITAPVFSIALLPETDWVTAVQQDYPPLSIANFFVYGSHYDGKFPVSSHHLHIDAGRAFGTGEHETTSSCLAALYMLAKKYRFTRPLDMGCGSGILAIAMAKTWKHKVIAADLDAQAVKVTIENARINQVSHSIQAIISNGYTAPALRKHGPYDLIMSNILAKPLCRFAPSLAQNLAPNGIAVVSGLLRYQEPMVLSAHRAQGLHLVKAIHNNAWSTLILARHL